MVEDWATVVEFIDGTSICIRGSFESHDRYCKFKCLERNGERTSRVIVPYFHVKMVYDTNPEKMNWPEDEYYFEYILPETNDDYKRGWTDRDKNKGSTEPPWELE